MLTTSPTFTFTVATVPEEENERSSVASAATVPSAETVWAIVSLVAATTCSSAGAD
ncbi:MAG: hypothetical protein R2735_04180 [Microthrixaceae bacterium]